MTKKPEKVSRVKLSVMDIIEISLTFSFIRLYIDKRKENIAR